MVDTITGTSGDDILAGGSGAQVIDGGAGYDTVDYSGFTSPVYVNLSPVTYWIGHAPNPHNEKYLMTKRDKLGHTILKHK